LLMACPCVADAFQSTKHFTSLEHSRGNESKLQSVEARSESSGKS
jgi:hypothetical protein